MENTKKGDLNQSHIPLDETSKENPPEQKPDRSWAQAVIDNLNKNVNEADDDYVTP